MLGEIPDKINKQQFYKALAESDKVFWILSVQ